MSSLPASSSPVYSPPVQLCWSLQFGPMLRQNGQSRPISLDAIARDFGAREVERILECPGRFLPVDAGPLLATPHPKLLPVHPGTPPCAKVRITVKIIKDTGNAYLVELPEDARGAAWLPRKVTGPINFAYLGATVSLHVPLWLYNKLREQL